MPAFGPWELIVILLIVVVIFGAGRLSEPATIIEEVTRLLTKESQTKKTGT